LSYLRLREYASTVIARAGGGDGWRLNERRPVTTIHRALLAGLGNIGFKSEEAGIYLGARQIKFVLSPASAVRKKGPKWVMAAELTETTRLFARCVAAIEPEWIEKLGQHLARRSYREPHWSKDSGSVVAYEQVTVYGLVVVPKRRVQYGPIDPKEARELFILGALVAGHYAGNAPFLDHNRRLIDEVQELEHKSRRHDVLVDDQAIFAFYAERIAQGIYSAVDFEKWRKEAERDNPKLLFLTRDYLMRHSAEQVTEVFFPDALTVGMQTFDLTYRFEPGHALDGVTMIVPLHLLNQLDERRCEWLVPGLLRDKITYLIKALPKGMRKHFVPVPQVVTDCMEILEPDSGPLAEALSQALFKKTGVEVPVEAWDGRPAAVPADEFQHSGRKRHGNRIRTRTAATAQPVRRQGAAHVQRGGERRIRAQGADHVGLRRVARAGRGGTRRAQAGRLSGDSRRGKLGSADASGYRSRGRRSDPQGAAPTVSAGASGADEVPGAQPSWIHRIAVALRAAGRARRRQAGQGWPA
jgi:hypothetical protein